MAVSRLSFGNNPRVHFSGPVQAPPAVSARSAAPLPFKGLEKDQFTPVSRVQFGTQSSLEASIPVVDLGAFLQAPTEAARQAFAKDFGQKLQQYGFIAIKNHGIPNAVFQRHFEALKNTMSGDRNELARYQIDEVSRMSGYNPFGELKPDSQGNYTAPDPKHMWHTQPWHNVYPPSEKEFAAANYQLFQELNKVGTVVLDVLGRFLGKQELLNQFAPKAPDALRHSMMRAIHYPKLGEQEKSQVRSIVENGTQKWVRTGEHRDLSLFTLLPEATASGLQLLPNVPGNDTSSATGAQKPENRWLDVFAQEGYIIMNAGDTMRYMTEGLTDEQGNSLEIPSTWHRVVGDNQVVDRDRFSVPFFFNGNFLKPMPLLKTGEPVRRMEAPYNDVTLDPALRMIWARYARSGTVALPYKQYEKNFRDMGQTIQQVLASRGLSTAYHAGA